MALGGAHGMVCVCMLAWRILGSCSGQEEPLPEKPESPAWRERRIPVDANILVRALMQDDPANKERLRRGFIVKPTPV
jgi:hypothetical protein